MTPAQLQQLGLYQQVLDQLINHNVLEQELIRSGLSVSDSLIRNRVHAVPAFQQNGVFNKQLFQELLRQNGMNEARFVHEIKQTLLTQQLFSPLVQGMSLPAFYQEALLKSLDEKKIFTVMVLPFDKVTLKQQPSLEDLQLRYNQNKDQYAVPEFRSVTLVLIQAKNLLSQIPISETEISQEYENQKQQFVKPERRAVKRLSYATEILALEAARQVNTSRPMSAVARDITGGEYEDLGTVEKKDLPEIGADVVFNLGVGKVSEVINTGFGYTIYQVTKIEPEMVQSIDEVRTQILENLRLQKFGDRLQDLKNKIEDSLAAGVSLADVAKENNLSIEAIPSFNQLGQTLDDKPVLASLAPEVRKKIVEQAFSLADGTESPLIEADAEISFVVHLDKIIPSYVPEFDKIKVRVQKDWIAEKKFEEGAQLAQTLSQQAKSLADMTRLANQYGLTLTSNHALTRREAFEANLEKQSDLQKKLTPEVISKGLQLPLENATYGLMRDHKGFAILMLQRVEPFTVDTQKLKKFQEILNAMLEKDMSALLLQHLRAHYKITINQDMLKILSQEAAS